MSYKTEANKKIESTHRDPITDAAGAHPIGTGIGPALGGSANTAPSGYDRDGK